MENSTRTRVRVSSSRMYPSPTKQPNLPAGRSISPRAIRVQHSVASTLIIPEGKTNFSACQDRAGGRCDTGGPCPPERCNAENLPPLPQEARDDDDDVGTALPPLLGPWNVTQNILTDPDRLARLVDSISTMYLASAFSESKDTDQFPQTSSWRGTSNRVSDLGEISCQPPHKEPDPIREFVFNASSFNKPNSTPQRQSFDRICAISAKQGDDRCTGTSSRPASLPCASSARRFRSLENRPPVSWQNQQGSDAMQGFIQKEMIGLSENVEVLLSLTDPLNVAPPISSHSASATIRIEGSTESQFLPHGPSKEAHGITFKSQEELYAWCRRQLSVEQATNEIRLNLSTLSTHLETLKQRTHVQKEQRREERVAMSMELSACAALLHERDVRLEALRLENSEQKGVIACQRAALGGHVTKKPSTKEALEPQSKSA